MTNWFLRAKHWQLFLLILVAPIIIELIAIPVVITTKSPAIIFPFAFLMMVVTLGTQFGWYYSVGTALAGRLPSNAGMNVRRFRNFVFIPVAYLTVLLLGFGIFAMVMMDGGRPSPMLGLSFIVILPMHFFSIFCIFYSMWFVAKSLKMVERYQFVEFGDYAGDFFLIWFFFVGVWFIQPRINRLFDPTLPPAPQQPYPQNYYPPNYNPNYGQGTDPTQYPYYQQHHSQNPEQDPSQ